MSLFTELKRRNVFRVGLFYIVAAWVIVQVAETLLPVFDVPDTAIRAIVLVLALGFPSAVVFAWVFELTPEGLKLDKNAQADPAAKQRTANKLNWATLVAAALAIGLLIADRMLPEAYMLGNNLVADSPRAGQLVDKALAIAPDLAAAIMVRGNLAMIRGNPLTAYTDYQHAIELAPAEPRPYHWIGLLYTSMGYVDQGEQAIARAAELEPGNANVRGWQSVLLARRGAREEAVRAALQQARLGNPVGHMQAVIYLLDSDIDRAAEQLRLAELAGEAMAFPLRPLMGIGKGETDQIEPFVQSLRAGEVDDYWAMAGLLALDLDEIVLQTLDDLDPDYDPVHALFWTDANAPLRADPRFIRFKEQMGAFPLWRELGPPPDCVAQGDSFRCGLTNPAQ